MTLYVKVIEGSNIPPQDKSGLCDPFCVLEINGRKDPKKTDIRTQTLTPLWNQEFQFKVLSYNSDVFTLSLYDYDKMSKNDLIGKWTKEIKNIPAGIVQE